MERHFLLHNELRELVNEATAKAMPNTYKVNSSYYVTYSHFILAYDKDTIQ